MREGSAQAINPALVAVRVIPGSLARIWRSDSLRRLHRHKSAVIGEILLLTVALAALLAPFIAPYPVDILDSRNMLAGPTLAHPFGTDFLGRDILSRVVFGGRVSLLVGLGAVTVGLAGGVIIGLISGYKGGSFVDQVIMAIVDGWRAFPGLILALVLIATLGPDIKNLMLAIGTSSIPSFARLTRGQVLSTRENEYVVAARAMGCGVNRILWRHIFPNVLAPVIVLAIVNLAYAILAEAGLSFLGLGVQPPTPTWGEMVRSGYPYLETAPWFSLIPGTAIFFTVVGALLFGNGLRDALDPRRR